MRLDLLAAKAIPGTPRRAVLAGRTLAICAAAYLLVAPFASTAGTRGALLAVAALALAAIWRESLLSLRSDLPRDVALAAAAWVALCILSLAWSVDLPYSVREARPEILYPAVAFGVFFVAATRAAAPWRAWVTAAILGGALTFLAQLFQDLLHLTLISHAIDGGPGAFSTHLVLLFPLVLSLRSMPPWGRGLGTLPLTIALCVLFAAAWYSGNRMVWVALAAEMVVFVIASRRGTNGPAATRASIDSPVALSMFAIAAGFIISLAERNEQFPQFAGLHDLRLGIWSVAWQKFIEAPVLGHGFGREILASTFASMTSRPENLALAHAHNVFIDIALQLGIVGLLVFLALLAALARRFLAMLADARVAPLGAIGLALLAGFVVKNLTDDFLHRQNGLVFWALNAALLGLGASAARNARPKGSVE